MRSLKAGTVLYDRDRKVLGVLNKDLPQFGAVMPGDVNLPDGVRRRDMPAIRDAVARAHGNE